MNDLVHIGRRPESEAAVASQPSSLPDWAQAAPARIQRALAHSSGRPTGGWFALDASAELGDQARGYTVAGQELVAWRHNGAIVVAPAACPHMGANLAEGKVCRKGLVCPWHGLVLEPSGHGRWRPFRSHDDGVLLWVQPFEDGALSPVPSLPQRPTHYVEAVHCFELACDPEDVIANRLDPWHGAHLHPHSFAALEFLGAEEADRFRLRVSVRVLGPVCADAVVEFSCPSARSIVMTILDGEGKGSVLETHATPIAPGRTRVVEATLATSERFFLRQALNWGIVRRWMRSRLRTRAKMLWADDIGDAERLYQLRRDARRQRWGGAA